MKSRLKRVYQVWEEKEKQWVWYREYKTPHGLRAKKSPCQRNEGLMRK